MGDWLKNTRNGVTVFCIKTCTQMSILVQVLYYVPSQPNPARAKESEAHNLNQRAHQQSVITSTYSLELPIIHKNNPKRKQIPKLNKKPTKNKTTKNLTQ